MHWTNVVFPSAADPKVFNAPTYNETIVDGRQRYSLLTSNKFSYPALLHISMYTDIMNIFQYDPKQAYIGPRSASHQQRMAAAVQWGVLTSILALVGTVVSLGRCGRSVLFDPVWMHTKRRRNEIIVLGFSLAYFCMIALVLPFVEFAYLKGYWLSRLVMQALVGFVFLGFVSLGDVFKSRHVRLLVLAFSIGQAALHASFLWSTMSLPP
jgi:hypothetical protein